MTLSAGPTMHRSQTMVLPLFSVEQVLSNEGHHTALSLLRWPRGTLQRQPKPRWGRPKAAVGCQRAAHWLQLAAYVVRASALVLPLYVTRSQKEASLILTTLTIFYSVRSKSSEGHQRSVLLSHHTLIHNMVCTTYSSQYNNLLIGVSDQKCWYDSLDLATARSNVDVEPHFSPQFLNLIEVIMDEDSLRMPTTPLEAYDLYMHLTYSISSMLDQRLLI